MNNRDRTINYVRQNIPPLSQTFEASDGSPIDLAAEFVEASTVEHIGTKLTPKQRRRIKHKRSGSSGHYKRQRERHREQLARRISHWTQLLGN